MLIMVILVLMVDNISDKFFLMIFLIKNGFHDIIVTRKGRQLNVIVGATTLNIKAYIT